MEGPSYRVTYLVGPESIELREQPRRDPVDGEIRVRIEAATTCGTDVKVFRRGGHPRMLRVPGPFGHEMSGVIDATSREVSEWKEGDAVVVANSASCGHCEFCRAHRENLCLDLEYLNGAYGDEIMVPSRFVQRSLYRKPDGLEHAAAALAEPLACVLHGIELIEPVGDGCEVLVIGGGPIGLLFIDVLVSRGCRVFLADPNEPRLEAGLKLGASGTLVANREKADLEGVRELSEGGAFDLAIEATGSPVAWEKAISTVRPGGTVLLFGGCEPGTTMPLDTHLMHYSELRILGGYHHRPATFARAIERLTDDGAAAEILLTEELPLAELGEALGRMMRKEALKVVIRP